MEEELEGWHWKCEVWFSPCFLSTNVLDNEGDLEIQLENDLPCVLFSEDVGWAGSTVPGFMGRSDFDML